MPINVMNFGAKGDGKADDTAAIQAAIDSVGGETIFFPVGLYKISKPIRIKRGITLKGATTFDDTVKNASKIILADRANCSMVQTPAAYGKESTHYMAIENLIFDGNKLNQTVENPAIMFWGAWVGSWIRDTAIFNSFGPALSFNKGADLVVSNVWINGTDTKDYAVEFNRGISSSAREGLVNIHDLYIERTSNGTKPKDSTTPSSYGKGIWANSLVTLNITSVHFEHSLIGIDVQSCMTVELGLVSTSYCGDSARESALLRFLNVDTRVLKCSTAVAISPSSNFNMVMPTKGVSSNELPTIPCGNGFMANYAYCQYGWSDYYLPQNSKVLNQLRLVKNGGWDRQILAIQTEAANASQYHFVKGIQDSLQIGSNFGKTAEKSFLTMFSGGTNEAADCVRVDAPLYLQDRGDASVVTNGSVFLLKGNPVFSRGNNVYNGMVTVRTGSGAPTANADYIGQDYIDIKNRVAYKAVNAGTGSKDWKQTT
ncbi:glycosyl hydrolase family 28-related protein [Cohnella boryungensis]|uniref:Glycosyl hydrolase family 28-related protein n=1 Tax=Cohnella boryungensis TaxID=768479 RepID=A0ABV8S4W5_9BACL